MHRLIQTAALATVALGSYVVLDTAADVAHAGTTAVCADSNGSAYGGSVYGVYGQALGCTLVSGQRLHLTQTPSATACANAGGHGWTSANRICWDVDY